MKRKSVRKEWGIWRKFALQAHCGESVRRGRTLRYGRWAGVVIMENGSVEEAVSGRERERR